MTEPTRSAFSARFKARQENARRVAVRAVALLQGGILVTGAVSTYLLPVRGDFEWQIFLVLGVFSLGLFWPLFRALRAGDRDRELLYSTVLIGMGMLAFLQRVAFAYWGPLLETPGLYVFRPVLTYFPFLALAAVALGRASLALKISWGCWAAMTVIVVTGLQQHPEIGAQRDGYAFALSWLLVADPLFLLLLHTIPQYEHVLKMSESDLERAESNAKLSEALRISEHRHQMVIQGLQVGVWERDADSHNQYWWSPRLYELLGYTPEEMPASSASLRKLVHPEDLPLLREASTESKHESGVYNVNCRMNTKHDGYRWFNLRAQWERDEAGNWVGVAGAMADIHDRILAESALRNAQDALMKLAYSDPLTGVGNRRAFDERLAAEVDRAQRSGADISLLLLDLDYFKPYNDQYGHPAGDECLRLVGRTLRECVHRPADFIGRIGGEEFAILLPETDVEGAKNIATAVAKAIQALDIPHTGSPYGVVTGSIGIESTSIAGGNVKQLFDRADAALYRAKNSGRNCVVHL